MIRRAALALLLALGALAPARAAEPAPFVRGSWQALREAHAGRATVVHVWGVTCAPCLAELPEWGRLAAARPDLRLVLIAIDPPAVTPADQEAMLARAGLDQAESWRFAERFADRLRYEIDPRWRGEMPRTMLIGRDGAVRAISGVADLGVVRAWLDGQVRP